MIKAELQFETQAQKDEVLAELRNFDKETHSATTFNNVVVSGDTVFFQTVEKEEQTEVQDVAEVEAAEVAETTTEEVGSEAEAPLVTSAPASLEGADTVGEAESGNPNETSEVLA